MPSATLTVTQAITRLRREHAAWDESKFPGDSWWKAVDGAIETIGGASLTDPQLSLVDPVVDMINERFANENDETKSEMPSRDLMAAIARLLAAKPRQWPELESIKQLDKEKVRHSQIARMHGLTVGQVQAILDGEAAYPKGHVTPHVKDQQRSKKIARDKMRLAFNRYQQLKQISEIDTVADFLEEGATLGEVAHEFDADPDAVLAEARASGFVPDDGGMSIDEQIFSMADQGVSQVEIAEALNMSVQKVAGALRRRETPDEVHQQRKVRKKLRAAKVKAARR